MAAELNITNLELGVDFSVVVPVYNSERTLETLVERLGKVFRDVGRSYEIVLTDDCSQDGSWRVIQALHARGEPIRAFRFMRNHGQHFALKCGLDHCVGRYVITMDDDLQHPPEEIPKLIAALEADPELDVVSGVYDVKKHSGFRNLGSALNTRLVRAVFRTAPGVTLTSFAIYRRCVVDEVRKTHYARPRIGLIVLSVTSRIGNVTVRHEPRLVGRSQYTLRKLVADTFDSVLNYSVLPLRMMTWFGIGSSFLSFIAGLYYLGRYLAGGVGVPGYTSIILAVLFTGGLTLFCFGMVGEYLERIMKNQTAFSEYHVREEIALPSGAGQVSAGGADPAGREGAA